MQARAVDRLGAAETAPARGDAAGEQIRRKLDALLTGPSHGEAARRFAQKHAAFDPAKLVERMVERVEELMAERGRMQRRAKVFAG